jgi:putative endonuclease
MEKILCVYILASYKKGTFYMGVSSNLAGRVYQHKENMVKGFTQRYAVHKLVFYECSDCMEAAIERERKIKAGSRNMKIKLIENFNPQ